MNSLSSPQRVLAIAALTIAASTAPLTARALDVLVVTHSNSVAVPCAAMPNCLDIAVTGIADDFAGAVSPIPGAWSFALNYRLVGSTGAGSWSYTDLGPGGNNLFGTSMHVSVPLGPTLLKDMFQLTVLGGGGMFAGATGTGQGTAYIDTSNGNSVDSTVFSIATVPEPSAAVLIAAGLMALASRRFVRGSRRGHPAPHRSAAARPPITRSRSLTTTLANPFASRST